MSGHSPGPWTWDGEGPAEVSHGTRLLDSDGCVVLALDAPDGDCDHADARLIAAAPALLDLVRRLVSTSDGDITGDPPFAPDVAEWESTLDEARALLAKLDGGP